MLKLTPEQRQKIRHEAEQSYPEEGCGILIGVREGNVRTVGSVVSCRNSSSEDRRTRYFIDPRELIRAQREAHERAEDVIGFYHSHPDHPPEWSPTDLEEAHWIGCSYVITSVIGGKATVTRSFALVGSLEEDKRFVEEEMILA